MSVALVNAAGGRIHSRFVAAAHQVAPVEASVRCCLFDCRFDVVWGCSVAATVVFGADGRESEVNADAVAELSFEMRWQTEVNLGDDWRGAFSRATNDKGAKSNRGGMHTTRYKEWDMCTSVGWVVWAESARP